MVVLSNIFMHHRNSSVLLFTAKKKGWPMTCATHAGLVHVRFHDRKRAGFFKVTNWLKNFSLLKFCWTHVLINRASSFGISYTNSRLKIKLLGNIYSPLNRTPYRKLKMKASRVTPPQEWPEIPARLETVPTCISQTLQYSATAIKARPNVRTICKGKTQPVQIPPPPPPPPPCHEATKQQGQGRTIWGCT